MKLFHGGSEVVTEIENFGTPFDGVFATVDEYQAQSYGETVTVVEVSDDAVLTLQELAYEVDYSKTLAAFISVTGVGEDEEHHELLWSAVVDDNHGHDKIDALLEYMGSAVIFDAANVSWECQRLRGQLAATLGYKAVEMNDEHGTSFLVLSADKLSAHAEC